MKRQPPSSSPRSSVRPAVSRTSARAGNMPSQRQLRVGERIRHLLSDVLQRGELYDPVLAKSGLITVTSVDIAPDLKNARAYVMPLGGENAEEIVIALNKAAGYFRTAIGRGLTMRHTPKVTFEVDLTFDNMAHIDGLLKRDNVRRDIESVTDDDNNDD